MDITERKITKIAREAEKLVLLTMREEGVGTAEIDLIHALRHHPGCTQAQLAESAGLSRMTVQRTEGGDLDPRYSTLAEMARVLGMDIIAVPSSLRPSLEAFIQSGGKFLGQPEGVDAPPSVVDGLRR